MKNLHKFFVTAHRKTIRQVILKMNNSKESSTAHMFTKHIFAITVNMSLTVVGLRISIM